MSQVMDHAPATHPHPETAPERPPILSPQGGVAIGAFVMALYIAFLVYLFASH